MAMIVPRRLLKMLRTLISYRLEYGGVGDVKAETCCATAATAATAVSPHEEPSGHCRSGPGRRDGQDAHPQLLHVALPSHVT